MPTASRGDDSDDSGEKDYGHSSQEFEVFVRSTLAKLVDGQKQLEARLAASIEVNSEHISDLEKAKRGLEKEVSGLKAELSSTKITLEKQSIEINKREVFPAEQLQSGGSAQNSGRELSGESRRHSRYKL